VVGIVESAGWSQRAAAPVARLAKLDERSASRANRELPPDDQESRGAAEASGRLMIRLRHTLRIG
jgi:hypothetical protein